MSELTTKAVPAKPIQRLLRDDDGATAIEYGLILGLMALVCIVSFKNLGGSNGGGWDGVATKASNAMNK